MFRRLVTFVVPPLSALRPRRMLHRLGIFLWREPLAHFVFGGGLIFLAYCCSPNASPDAITITPAAAEAAFRLRAETIGRPLTGPERSVALAELVEEELLVREALRQGVDRQDAVIRARLADKMRFLLSGEPPAPTQEQLRAYLQANRQRFFVQGARGKLPCCRPSRTWSLCSSGSGRPTSVKRSSIAASRSCAGSTPSAFRS